jgi:hypothetical protein
MLPHPYTAVILMEFEYQERLREAARDRLASSAMNRDASLLAKMRRAAQVACGWRWSRRLVPKPSCVPASTPATS